MAGDFPFASKKVSNEAPRSLEEIEKNYIEQVLSECQWNQSRAARVLKIDRVTLYHKIKRYSLRRPGEEDVEVAAESDQ